MNEQSMLPVIQALLSTSNHAINTLSADTKHFEANCERYHLSEDSMVGSFAKHLGGLSVKGQLLTLLGANSSNNAADIFAINDCAKESGINDIEDFLVIAYDWLGGFFAVNMKNAHADIGNVCYYSVDEQAWEDLEIGVRKFYSWVLLEDLMSFYEDLAVSVTYPNEVGTVITFNPSLMDDDQDDTMREKKVTTIKAWIKGL